MSKALTPKAKGTGVGREVLQQGPMIMSPGGGFHPIPDMGGNDEVHAEGTEHEAFAFPLDNPGGGTNATAGASGTAGASFASRKLFGGAITMTLPTNFDDVSAIRDVPDHQEVFVDRNSEMSLIVEILDMEEEISDEAAAQHFFKDLAQFNEVGCNSVIFISVRSLFNGLCTHSRQMLQLKAWASLPTLDSCR